MEFPESFIYAGPAFSAPEQPVPAPYFRRQFRLERVPEQAELLICGIGFYELYVNGQRITRGRLAPYISSPDVAVYYDSYDITPLLKIGENVLGVWLGNGFQNNPGGYVWDFDKARFRGAPRFALRLDECSGEKRQAILESDKAFLTAAGYAVRRMEACALRRASARGTRSSHDRTCYDRKGAAACFHPKGGRWISVRFWREQRGRVPSACDGRGRTDNYDAPRRASDRRKA